MRHTVDPRFGLDDSLTRKELDRLLKVMEPMPSSTTQVMLNALYETSNDLYDHYSMHADGDPLSRVALHDGERFQRSSGMYVAIRRYEYQRISDRYGMSLTEYLDLPREMIEMMTLAAQDAIKEREEAEEEAKELAADKKDQDPITMMGPIVGPGSNSQ